MKSLAFGLASALLLSATASAQELKTYNPFFDKSNPQIPEEVRAKITEAVKINYANCIMKRLVDAQFKKGGAFVDSYIAVVQCGCTAYATQTGEQCNFEGEELRSTISREKLREYGVIKQ